MHAIANYVYVRSTLEYYIIFSHYYRALCLHVCVLKRYVLYI